MCRGMIGRKKRKKQRNEKMEMEMLGGVGV